MTDAGGINSETDKPWMKPWDLLRRGEFDQGLRILREEYEVKHRAAREMLRLGIGYMWAEMYDSAATHFTAATQRERNGENDFAFAGVAEWHLGNFPAAIQRWREGLSAQYAVGCRVCSMTARLLVVASALEPDRPPKFEAEAALLKATKRIDPSRWSGLLGRFLLGQVEMGEMNEWIEIKDRQEQQSLRWVTNFYSAGRRLSGAEIDTPTFRSLMRPMAEVVNSEMTDLETFTQLLRKPEYFLARTEAAKGCYTN